MIGNTCPTFRVQLIVGHNVANAVSAHTDVSYSYASRYEVARVNNEKRAMPQRRPRRKCHAPGVETSNFATLAYDFHKRWTRPDGAIRTIALTLVKPLLASAST